MYGFVSEKLAPDVTALLALTEALKTSCRLMHRSIQGTPETRWAVATGIWLESTLRSCRPQDVGIGFAIPSNMARDVLDQLVKNGKVSRGQLGVVVEPVTDHREGSNRQSDPAR